MGQKSLVQRNNDRGSTRTRDGFVFDRQPLHRLGYRLGGKLYDLGIDTPRFRFTLAGFILLG